MRVAKGSIAEIVDVLVVDSASSADLVVDRPRRAHELGFTSTAFQDHRRIHERTLAGCSRHVVVELLGTLQSDDSGQAFPQVGEATVDEHPIGRPRIRRLARSAGRFERRVRAGQLGATSRHEISSRRFSEQHLAAIGVGNRESGSAPSRNCFVELLNVSSLVGEIVE